MSVAEVERMIEAGELDPQASREALAYMAGQWLVEQVRKRERRRARSFERPATMPSTVAAVNRVSRRIAEQRRTASWAHLFDESFALPNGDRVTWRDATVAQHEARASMLEVMAAGDLETAALHRSAVTDISTAGTQTLGGIA